MFWPTINRNNFTFVFETHSWSEKGSRLHFQNCKLFVTSTVTSIRKISWWFSCNVVRTGVQDTMMIAINFHDCISLIYLWMLLLLQFSCRNSFTLILFGRDRERHSDIILFLFHFIVLFYSFKQIISWLFGYLNLLFFFNIIVATFIVLIA